MSRPNWIKIWAAQARAPFLLLAVVLTAIGGAAAFHADVFDWTRFVLCLVGVVLAHVAVNMFNEVSDHKTGIDQETRRTPFSGGSGTLQAGHLRPRTVFWVASALLGVALACGLWLAWRVDWWLLAFVIPGGLAAIFYTSHLARYSLGEVAAGMCLGSLVVLGAYYAQTGTLTPMVILLSLPPGILTALLLFLNEFPDREADAAGGRRHLVILLGRRRAAKVYAGALITVYATLIAGVISTVFPVWVLLALLTVPLAAKAMHTALVHGENFERMIPALGANVGVVLGTDLLLAVACLI